MNRAGDDHKLRLLCTQKGVKKCLFVQPWGHYNEWGLMANFVQGDNHQELGNTTVSHVVFVNFDFMSILLCSSTSFFSWGFSSYLFIS